MRHDFIAHKTFTADRHRGDSSANYNHFAFFLSIFLVASMGITSVARTAL